MRYLVIREADKEPQVLLWTKGQRPNPKDRDYPHTAYIKNHQINLDTISSAGYVFYDPKTQKYEIDGTASYQMDNHEEDREADFQLVIQSLSGFCLQNRSLMDEISVEWTERQAFLKHREAVLASLRQR